MLHIPSHLSLHFMMCNILPSFKRMWRSLKKIFKNAMILNSRILFASICRRILLFWVCHTIPYHKLIFILVNCHLSRLFTPWNENYGGHNFNTTPLFFFIDVGGRMMTSVNALDHTHKSKSILLNWQHAVLLCLYMSEWVKYLL